MKAFLQKMKTLLGEIPHTDLMKSSVPGLTPQMVGFLTSKKFHNTSFFVDDRSDCTFAHHQETANAAETITDNQARELDLRKFGKEVRNYHVEMEHVPLLNANKKQKIKSKFLTSVE